MFSVGNLLKNRFRVDKDLLDGKTEINVKLALAEVLLFVGFIYLLGFLFNKEDPLFVNSSFSIVIHTLPLVVLTLFYGFLIGSVYMIIFATVKYLIYGKLDTLYLLYIFLYLLVLSEFHFYWNRKIKSLLEKAEYIEDRLRDVGRALYLTKLSHDRLESYYIARPISIRGFIEELRRDMLKGISLEELLKRAVQFIGSIYTIEKGGLFKINGNKFENVVKLGGMEELNPKDSLIQKALEKGETTYVSDLLPESTSKYLCAIPLPMEGGNYYLFVIERMPFFNLNVDNILSINAILDYILFSYHNFSSLSDLHSRFGWISLDMLREIVKCAYLKEKYNIDSSIVVFKPKKWDESIYYLLFTVRSLDLVDRCENLGIMVLLPFTNQAGAYGFLRRFEGVLQDFKSASFGQLGIHHNIYEIKEVNTLLMEIEEFLFNSVNVVDRA
ncbi:MAG: PelD GGDEF domain-containing protein [Aquificaceae bacterium]